MVLTKIWGGWGGNSPESDPNSDPNSGHNEKTRKLPIRPSKQPPSPTVQIYPFESQDGLLVKIDPPREPANSNLHHVPCDLVLCIDVSGSMGNAAPVPSNPDGQDKDEEYGLSVLDLVKHAARTILETLDSKDRLGIITFSSKPKVLLPLTPMTEVNKGQALKKIRGMQPLDMTNLWHGIRDGLDLFKEGNGGQGSSCGRVPALLVLTDGIPNFMCPRQGYVPKLRTMEPLPATIHTFGFGYRLRSGLLKSIAEVGGGNYSFIPDAGMIGTVFVHAVANLQSTFASNAKLRLTYPSYLQLEETTGEAAVDKQPAAELKGEVPESLSSLTILLSNIQYGQSRDIYLRYRTASKESSLKSLFSSQPQPQNPPIITATLEYQHFTPTIHRATTHKSALDFSTVLSPAEKAYHISRSHLISFLSTFSPLNSEFEHTPLKRLPPDLPAELQSLAASLPAAAPEFLSSHPGCRSLLVDLCGDPLPAEPLATSDPEAWTGQVALALLNPNYHYRWGTHYLPSLAGAHARQVCNSFKDAGPLRYGADSPLFVACRDRLDEAFDALPAPAPSRAVRGGGKPAVPVSMRRFNNVGNGCFASCATVKVVDDGIDGKVRVVRVGRLKSGMVVVTPKGSRRVMGVLRMEVRRAEMCLVEARRGARERLMVTPWHPVRRPGEGEWVFPRDVAVRRVRYTGAVYSVLLERDEDAEAHAILVGGVWGVTMGHGMTEEGKGADTRAHQFYGDYNKVCRALARLPRTAGGVMMGGGLTRNPRTGLVNGFSRVAIDQSKACLGDRKRAIVA
ncbi:hypothetical protein VTI74DRAFT_11200 [Chaetomium olivicolor]